MMKDFNISDFVEMTDEELQEINGGRQSAVEGGGYVPSGPTHPWFYNMVCQATRTCQPM
ncbi:MAG: ComC/BlpC family leader-containing pheromone/bacteriocin [Streptococcaceae bacterium]|jgi:bacteriocin-like protein|nr:ComC/BlpC family leader-containing pheromone/bacteriocin [Streptococcaceae bacterium]